MAQGFLLSSGNTVREMEQIGRNYFDDLAMRSFFQDFEKSKSGNNLIISCKMHDTIHDFAQFLTENECLILERDDKGTPLVPGQNTRHVTITQHKGDTSLGPFSIWQAEQLRSCFCSGNEIPLNLFSRLKRVRLLSLHACRLKDIPKEIGNLIHIRYLDVSSNTQIKELPETIYDLHYLQTLNVDLCTSLGGLPAQGIHKLTNLRHLLNSEASFRDFRFPEGFEKLTNLRTLSEFNASASGNNLGCLKGFNHLGGTLCIQLHGDFDDELEAKKADLASKKYVESLRLEAGTARTETIEALQPHSNLPILMFDGQHLPKWIDSLTNLRKLTIRSVFLKSSKVTHSWLPLAKLPLLEDLNVIACRMVRIGHDFLGISERAPSSSSSSSSCRSIFPKLKILSFKFCSMWAEWEDISEEQAINVTTSILPCLQELHLYECSALKSLPHRLLNKASSLRHLTVHNCGLLQSRYNEETGPDRTELSHIQRVEFSTRKSILTGGFGLLPKKLFSSSLN
ncbi:putative disease resistance protein RGA1 [Sesamum alatum]|uniref:Disease resistance protein RGA1 n=1 Tax=Sesamum alatum TaxID=300844 RepID=A0AAE1Y8V1_9LAMI|nr:putative disease resistance protein RGA1 [Sesamum alatum]